MTVILKSKDLFDIVSGKDAKPRKTDGVSESEFAKQLKMWVSRDNKAQEIIITRMEEGPVTHLLTCESANEMWQKLLSVYEQHSEVSLHQLQQKFFNLKYEDEGIALFISKIQELEARLKQYGEKLSEQMLITKVLVSLPEKYKHFVSAWESVPAQGQKLSELTSRLLIEEERSGEDRSVESALLTTKKLEPDRNKCFTCGKFGHVKADCWRNKNAAKTEKNKALCYYCKKPGHFLKDCRLRLAKGGNQNNKGPPSYGHGHRNNVNAFISAALIGEGLSTEDWYADSGASEHMCSRRNIFSEFSSLEGGREIVIGNGCKLKALGMGTVKVEAYAGDHWVQSEIRDVLFVPDLKFNLFSVGAVLRRGFEAKWSEEKCVFIKENEVRAVGLQQGKLYRMQFREPMDLAAVGFGTEKMGSLQVWHEKLAHQNVEQVKYILRERQMVVPSPNEFFCGPCVEGKHKRESFPLSKTKTTETCEIIHADICGPMETQSLGNAKYFLLIVDDFSKYRYVYFLKHKSEAVEKMKVFLQLAKNVTGKNVKILRTGNDLELVSHEMVKLTESLGIRHQRAAPYCPEQNGKVEREMRTIVEAGRTMLKAKNMEKSFWAEAVNTAVYVINRTGKSSVNGKTPHWLWFNAEADIRQFQIFGSTAYVHVPKERRKKWDVKSLKGLFVGYQENSKAFRVYVPSRRRVEVSRNVVFQCEADPSQTPTQAEVIEDLSAVNESEPSEEVQNGEGNLEAESSPASSHQGKVRKDFKGFEPIKEAADSSRYGEYYETMVLDDTIEMEGSSERMTEEQSKGSEDTKSSKLRNRGSLKKPQKLNIYETNFCASSDPLTYQDAINGSDNLMWKNAMDAELRSIEENKTWTEVVPPENCHVIGSKWVFKVKYDEQGQPSQYKARLVAKGFEQNDQSELGDIYAPVAKLGTVRILLAVATHLNLPIYQMDVQSAFLYGDIEEEVYMSKPEGVGGDGATVYRLNKSLYGLKKSPKYWNEKFNRVMEQDGFERSKHDCCLFMKNSIKSKLYVLMYVDDLLIVGSDEREIRKVKLNLKNNFKMKDLGEASNYLGINISQDRKEGTLKLNQTQFLKSVLVKYGMENCRSVATPMDPSVKISKDDQQSEDRELETKCRKLIGSLMYAAVGTRPDLCATLSFLSRYQNCASEVLWTALKRVLRYIRGTLNVSLVYRRLSSAPTVEGYVDADWGGDQDDRKSTSGTLFIVLGCTVTWSSRKQHSVALSSTESEYMALSSAAAEACWLRGVLNDMGMLCSEEPVVLYEDNQAAIKVSKNAESSKRLKHVDIRYHFIKEKIEDKVIDVQYVATQNQVADGLTKPLNAPLFQKFVCSLGLE